MNCVCNVHDMYARAEVSCMLCDGLHVCAVRATHLCVHSGYCLVCMSGYSKESLEVHPCVGESYGSR